MGNKKDKAAAVLFENFSLGIATNRDAWVYNYSKDTVASNMQRMIGFYNEEMSRYTSACTGLTKEQRPDVEKFINTDSSKISWTRALKGNLSRLLEHHYDETNIVTGLYRPFSKQYFYFNKYFNEMVYQMPRIFPIPTVENRVICVSGIGARSGFSSLIFDKLTSLDTIEKGQCFPLYLYEPTEISQPADNPNADMFAPKPQTTTTNGYTRKNAITDAGLKHFTDAYPTETISKEDLFYYIYGLLHSPDYRTKYADNLSKELPRIPKVATAQDFWAFSKAGRKLADLHINYETQPMYAVEFVGGSLLLDTLEPKDFYVEKMKFGKSSSKAAGKDDKTTIIYNSKITVTGIPLEAYEYVVNGKTAIEWVMERYGVSTHKDSGIVNDANAWGLETANNPRYPLELLLRVITVSLETMRIVGGLPRI